METQPQSARQSGQMAKKEPLVAVNEAAMTAPTYVSTGDDYGMPTPGVEERETMRYNPGLRPAKYEAIRDVQAEGLGLLQGGGSVAWRKEIPRKSVPGHGNGSGNS
jgi:hypothetical protein